MHITRLQALSRCGGRARLLFRIVRHGQWAVVYVSRYVCQHHFPLSPYRFQSLQWKILRLPLTLSRYQEVSDLLYTQNTFEFDHPMTLRLFKKTLHPSSLNSIKSISINLQKGLYYPLTPTQAYTHLRDWQDMWTIISAMEGLEEIRVRFQFPAKWSFMSPEKEMLASLWQVKRPMRVFEVDTGGAIFFNFEQTADAPFKLLRHEA